MIRKSSCPIVGRLLCAFVFAWASAAGAQSVSPTAQETARLHDSDSERVETLEEAPHNLARGKIIRSISIKISDVFENPDSALYRTANAAKVNTKPEIIRRELLFREGEPYDGFVALESERRLRNLKYLRRVAIRPTVDGDFVDVEVAAQDVWTFLPQFNYNSSAGRQYLSAALIETNFVGLGKRIEIGYESDESREVVQGVYDDNRIFGSEQRFIGALFQRSDGHEGLLYFGKPFRSLLDRSSWYVTSSISDTIGRLFENGSEEYIFRQNKDEIEVRHTWALGDPEKNLHRYSLGYTYQDDEFEAAGIDDYNDLDLDPAEVSNDPARLPEDRRYTGPVIAYQHLEQNFVAMNYIDRFDRIEDYNLGDQYDIILTWSPEFLGSQYDTALVSLNRSIGHQFSRGSFIRGEVGFASRFEHGDFTNTLARTEVKYYNVLGDLHVGDTFFGKHTFASSFFLDFGDQLDGDRQFAVGGDNALRGYKSRAFNGNKRMVLNIEDRVHLVDDLFQLMSVGAAAFVDVGGASSDGLESIVTEELYGDAGLGLRVGFPRSTGGGVVRFDVAVPFRDADDGTNALEFRIVFGAGQLFSSKLRSETLGPDKANIDIGFDR